MNAKRSLIFSIFLFISGLTLFSQTMNEMVVLKQAEFRSDQLINASRKDAMSRVCAGLLIYTDLTGLHFDSNNGVVDMTHQPGSYMIFVSEGERVLYIYKDGFRPLEIILSEYGIYDLKSGQVYQLDITSKQEQRMGELNISSQPLESEGAEIFVNNIKREETSPAVIPLLIGNYEISLNHPNFLKETKSVTIQEGKTDSLEFQMRIYAGSLQAKENFWKRNKWISLGVTVLTIGAGYYFDMQGQMYIDDYKNAPNQEDEYKAWKNSENALDNRNLCIYISIAPITYTIISWYKQVSYRRKMK